MSHRIIISSSAGGVSPADAAAQHQTTAAVEINVIYTPSHMETDKQALARTSRLMKLVRKMEAAIIEPPVDDDHED